MQDITKSLKSVAGGLDAEGYKGSAEIVRESIAEIERLRAQNVGHDVGGIPEALKAAIALWETAGLGTRLSIERDNAPAAFRYVRSILAPQERGAECGAHAAAPEIPKAGQ